jgi:ferritin-like metal-binding protein YciE
MMAAKSLRDLFVEELRDMYDGEKRLVRALPKMAKAAGSDDLRAAFTNHLKETQVQARRLEQVFRSLGEKPRGKKCDGIMGIVEEGNKAIDELEGPVLDAALIAGGQKVEHYEIASYGTLAYFADLLGEERPKALLGETLEEEKAADQKLNQIAKSKVNREALMSGGSENEPQSPSWRVAGSVRRVAASIGLAEDRSSSPRRQRKTSKRRGRSSKKRA